MIVDQGLYNPLRRRERVTVPHNPCSVVEDRFEKLVVGNELGLTTNSKGLIEFSPHIGDDNDVLQRLLATQRPEHTEVSFRDATHLEVGNAVHVDDTAEFVPLFETVSQDGEWSTWSTWSMAEGGNSRR